MIPNDNLIAIHDSARPILSEDLLMELYKTAQEFGGAVPALPLTDTVKEIDENGFIVANPVRERLQAVQTPQIFNFKEYSIKSIIFLPDLEIKGSGNLNMLCLYFLFILSAILRVNSTCCF